MNYLLIGKKKICFVRKLHLLLQEKSLIKDHIVQKELENGQKAGLKMEYCQYQCKVVIKKQNQLWMMKMLLKKAWNLFIKMKEKLHQNYTEPLLITHSFHK